MRLRSLGGPWLAMVFDAGAAGAALLCAFWLRFELSFLPDRLEPPFDVYMRFALVVAGVSVVALHGAGVYRKGRISLRWDSVARIFRGSVLAFFLVAAISFLIRGGVTGVQEQSYSRLTIGISWVLALLLHTGWRAIYLTVENLLNRQGWGVTRVLMVGVNPTSVRFCQAIEERFLASYRVVGFVSDGADDRGGPAGDPPVVGAVDDLEGLLRAHDVQEVVAALQRPTSDELARLLKVCARSGVRFRSIPDVPSLLLSPVRVEEVAGFPLFAPEDGLARPRSRFLKRSLDLALSLSLLPIVVPVGAILALLIRWSSKGSVFFVQERVGQNGRTFRMYKFRSMVHDAEEHVEDLRRTNGDGADPVLRLRDDPRVTPVGRFMRGLSLDELPQFINVLKGEMSLVGPRPHVPYEVACYSEWHQRRHDVLPGITGLTQVSGRRSLSLDDMIKLDIYYIENWSVWLDLRILVQTIPIVLSGRGAY